MDNITNDECILYIAAQVRPIIPYPKAIITFKTFCKTLLGAAIDFYKYEIDDYSTYDFDSQFKFDIMDYINNTLKNRSKIKFRLNSDIKDITFSSEAADIVNSTMSGITNDTLIPFVYSSANFESPVFKAKFKILG